MANADPTVRFILNGRSVELSRAEVERRLKSVMPTRIQKHAVRANGVWFPVRQAFEVATGISRLEFTSHTARRHLEELGLEVRGYVATPESAMNQGATATPKSDADARQDAWHTEANVQSAVVRALAVSGWDVLSVANTATKEHGVDVIARRDGDTVGVEVKGFPSRSYADPARASETKPTQPSTQAGHWYAAAVLAAMRLRGREPGWSSVIALPDFPRYRDLYSQTAGSLSAAEIDVWWVAGDGAVAGPTQTR